MKRNNSLFILPVALGIFAAFGVKDSRADQRSGLIELADRAESQLVF